MIRNTLLAGAVLIAAGTAAPAYAQNIVEVAQSDDAFSSLVEAVVSQDLVDTLTSEGPFTVFAPTNDAFAALPGYVGDVLADEPELLTDILLFHVVSGALEAGDVLATDSLETAGGGSLAVNLRDGAPFVNASAITATDIMADNGVVHVIDTVLIPTSVYEAAITNIRAELFALVSELAALKLDRANAHMN